MKTDVHGYPTTCAVCGEKIIKSKHDVQYHFDHATGTASAWHTTCSNVSHLFFCKGKPAKIEEVLGSWFCTGCGGKVDWVIA